jgi:hypothetical protein
MLRTTVMLAAIMPGSSGIHRDFGSPGAGAERQLHGIASVRHVTRRNENAGEYDSEQEQQ